LRVSLPWTLLGLHYHGIGAASRNSRRNSQEPILAPWEEFLSQNPTTPRLSLINSASASLTIVLHESRNRAPKFLELRRNFTWLTAPEAAREQASVRQLKLRLGG
jgi:hypothetical protein